jgi:hypothetical protein
MNGLAITIVSAAAEAAASRPTPTASSIASGPRGDFGERDRTTILARLRRWRCSSAAADHRRVRRSSSCRRLHGRLPGSR